MKTGMKKTFLILFAVWLLISFQVANAQAPAGCVVYGTTYDFNVPVTTKLNFKVLEVKKQGLLVRQFKNRKFGFTTATGVTSTILPQGSTARIKGDVAGFDGKVFFAIPSTDSVALTDLQPANVSVQSQGGYVQIKEIDNLPTKTIQGLNDTLVVDVPLSLRKGTLADTLGLELSKLTNTLITTSDSLAYWNTAAAAWRKSIVVDAGAGGGEANTYSAPTGSATSYRVIRTKSGVDLPFKNLVEGTNITIDSTTTTVTINSTGSGETNTASNLGGGLANFDSKLAVDLRFNSFLATDFNLAANQLSLDRGLAATWTSVHSFADNNLQINNPANTFQYIFGTAALAADRIMELPLLTGTDTFSFLGLAQTFTGIKTISADWVNTTNPWAENEIVSTVIVETDIDTYSELNTIVADETLSHSSLTETLTNKTVDSFTNDIFADHVHEEIRNESGGALAVGDAVYISGFSVGQSLPLGTLADASGAGTMPAVAILQSATLANNANGDFVEVGTVTAMNTSAWSVGDDLYISETGTSGNTLTNTKPTGTALIQKVAEVLRSHATLGVIEVFGAGRTNDLPNIPSANFWVGNGSGVPTQVTMSSHVTMDNTGVTTIAANVVGESQLIEAMNFTATGTWSFRDNLFQLQNPANSFQYIFGTNAIVADRTIDLPILSGNDVFTFNSFVNLWGDGIKQTFNPDATNAGLNAGSFAGQPSSPVNGDIVYNSTANQLQGRANGAWVDLGAGAGGGETNTASNLGGGLANFDTKSGVDLRFNSFLATDFNLAANVLSLESVFVRTDQTNTFGVFAQIFDDDNFQIDNPARTFQYIFNTNAIVADRIVTLPLLTGGDTFTFNDFAQTLTNKTLTTPTIGSFTNATHDHQAAAGGGVLDVAAVTTGVFAVARGGIGVGTGTGLAQGNGTGAFTFISNSSTVGQILRVTGANTYGWGALNLDDSDAFTGTLPTANVENTSGTNTGDEVAATLTVQGIIEIATGTETNTGTDATRAVSPDGLDDWIGSAQVTTLGTIATGVWNGTAITYANLNFSNNIVAGDIATSAVETTEILDGTVSVEDVQPELDNRTITFSIIDTVKAADLIRVKEFNYPITLDSVVTNTDVGTATFNFDHRVHTTPRTSGTQILTASLVADAFESTSTFDDNTIPANRPIYLVMSGVSGGAKQLDVTIFYKID